MTELDFRKPEYRDAKVEDYEFRADGALVRKDRWEVGIRTICGLVGMSDRDFEIPDVVSKVEQLATDQEGWMAIEDMEDSDDYPAESTPVSIQLSDASILKGASYSPSQNAWLWRGQSFREEVSAWKEESDSAHREGLSA
ncbi:hypothetical protein PZT57_30500 [Pseudomonas aeruginosa]|uniref:hypothetical protein n=1 Tax=Pseudomonas aeruginosa TaxID=287 RepID=UPI002B268BC1|nr:hypothetical protein [Pseudomonas aeruginosa]MEA8592979.1 hypothetical protein [Pseudomonas aeruginosa]